MTTRRKLDETDRRRIAQAIAAAEQESSGEIYCVLADTSDSYFYPAAFALALFMALLAPLVAAALHYFWYDMPPFYFALGHLFALLAAFAVIALFPSVRMRLVPRALRYRRAHHNAVKQFLSRNIHRTRGRTGVLVFVSLAERYAEMVADTAIDEKVPQAEWDRIVAGLAERARQGAIADGFVEAVEAAGALLARHFPDIEGDTNELDDHIAEI